jgi:hypothetical protein
MATLHLPDEIKAKADALAAESGFDTAEEFVAALIEAEAAGAPPELTVSSDEELLAVVDKRLDGPWVEVDTADLARIKAKFIGQSDRPAGQP